MRLRDVELRRLNLPLVSPFRTSFGTQISRDVLLVRVVTDDSEGWGECVAFSDPLYSSEYVDGAIDVIRRFLIPALVSAPALRANLVGEILRPIHGHRMAKGAVEMAVLDAELRARNVTLAAELGAVKTAVPSGVSVGILESIPALIHTVAGYLAEGYLRIKLKIEPGWDLEPVRAVREAFGDILLQVDANTAYTLRDADHLHKLDDFDLLMIEQPLAEDDLIGHVQLAKLLGTPICLDESIHSARSAAAAIRLGGCRIINVKPGRVGGYLEARRIHDVCVANGVPVWCGGMLETGLGRAANTALAALPGFTLPGDISSSERFYLTDITDPLQIEGGLMRVPTGAGIGVIPRKEELSAFTSWSESIPISSST